MAVDHDDERLREKGYLPGQVAPEEAARLVRLNLRDEAARRRQVPNEWDAGHVYARLVEAFAVLRRTPMQTRPRGHTTLWPAYEYSRADLNAQATTYAFEQLKRVRNRVRIPPSAAEITRADEAMRWCMLYLKDRPEHARAVLLSALWHLTGVSISEECKRRKMSRSAFYKRSAQGLAVITARLVADGVAVK